MRGSPDRVSLAAGVACLLVGAVFGLDQLDVIELTPGLVAAALLAAAGLVLVVSGLEPRAPRDPDGRGDE